MLTAASGAMGAKGGLLLLIAVMVLAMLTTGTLGLIIERVTGRPLATDHQPARASDVGRIVLDVRRAREHLGWQAKVALEQGIRESWKAFLGPGLRP